MGKLDDLIIKLCPDGVEFRHMWELTTWDKKFIGIERYKQPAFIKYNYLLANDLRGLATEKGNVKLLYTGVTDSGVTTEKIAGENLCEGEIAQFLGALVRLGFNITKESLLQQIIELPHRIIRVCLIISSCTIGCVTTSN